MGDILDFLKTDDVFSSPVLVDKEQRGSAWPLESKDGQSLAQRLE